MNVVTKQALGFLGAFLALFFVVGAGIELSLRTLNSEYRIVSAVVLGLVLVSLAVVSAVAISARPSVSNPYWSPK
ncbi:hypothetical protein [Halorientalis salina]|uniref:hypothetical protein n=1 Tax=Halorientalis salina TaxID=2932266 RepID=UPI0010ACCD40|nr:hypothetical protein [Halorientalis salina]